MEQTFDSIEFTEAQKMKYDIRMLDREAFKWWNSVSLALSRATRTSRTWGVFSNKVKTKYCVPGEVQWIERDGSDQGYVGRGSSKKFKGNSEAKRSTDQSGLKWCTPCASKHKVECTKYNASRRRCGKKGHMVSDCRSTKQMCYYCREMGHIATNCPNKKTSGISWTKKEDLPKPKARAFQMTIGDANGDDEVV
ncbi:hypothetical protein CTI12_AA392220 [Artemisia annua]|uniref:CCHC-type domain-containing protein n=1 Tax=Artemisia annua TaxID=35608 RepID=A0A2U1MDK7_ARTAN|nr:hypothetical protein CTI12_AA392220 [Artemisia annua]